MHTPESVQENETYEILWDFEIQTDHPILARRLGQVLINEEKEPIISLIWLFQQPKSKKKVKR